MAAMNVSQLPVAQRVVTRNSVVGSFAIASSASGRVVPPTNSAIKASRHLSRCDLREL